MFFLAPLQYESTRVAKFLFTEKSDYEVVDVLTLTISMPVVYFTKIIVPPRGQPANTGMSVPSGNLQCHVALVYPNQCACQSHMFAKQVASS
tara:strand:+ start:1052 stop:1327 length:276 start_codon:yes stop_codon:yes gene_type:complete